ncbi:MAG: hypothetical protein ABWX88_06075 [Pseudoxanthomonas sp.]
MATRKKTKSKVQETTLRHLWLASLGAAAMIRREAVNAANDAAAKVESLKQEVSALANEAQVNLLGGIASVREQGEAKASRFSADVEARLAPVLVKLGLKPQTRKTARRKPAKKTVAKRTRTVPARKPAAKRTVRKTRG